MVLGNGTGSFGSPNNFAVGTFPSSVAVADFNGDGKSDLATANQSSNNVSVVLGNGTGSFGSATNFAVGSRPFSVAVGDFNGDGKSDLAIANSSSNNVSVLLNNGTGSFGSPNNFAVGLEPYSVAVGDFNGDGKSDLAVANQSSNNVSVLLNTTVHELRGTSNRDILSGTDGYDAIFGLEGADNLTGGGGNDQFVYTSIRDRGDTITDFQVGSDKLVFTQLLDSLVPGGYNGTNALADGYVRVVQGSTTNNFSVQIDADGSGADVFRPFISVNTVGAATLNNPANFIF